MITTARRAVPVLALASLLGGLGTVAASSDAFAATQSRCSVERGLTMGRGHVTSVCTPVYGPGISGAKMVNQHRAVVHCDNIRGQGNAHDIHNTLYGPWKNPGEKSEVTCAIRSTLTGWDQQTN
ncbi:hypothetical protein [Streptomyces sp. NPDC089919]|uniref:hypothetical protein n=1 Tax=Streptomyces sp. NPDC089919 TaxID=3155188 RepID=UPI0034347834